MSAETLDARIASAQRTVRYAEANGYPVVALVDDFSRGYFEGLATHLLTKADQTSGVGRRLIFAHALNVLTDPIALFWTEPEKDSLPQVLSLISEPILAGRADIVIPSRKGRRSLEGPGWKGYPTWQPHWEMLINAWCEKIIGHDLDYAFGPRLWTRVVVERFVLKYPGLQPVPDAQDAIFGPLLDASRKGFRFAEVVVPFSYPADQGQSEEDDRLLFRRRAATLESITISLVEREMRWKDGTMAEYYG